MRQKRRTSVKHFLLIYEFGSDYLERRVAFREAHLQKAWAASDRGDLLLAGALVEPPDGAVLWFQGESKEAAEDFARTDPYVLNGLVRHWHVREWATVVGDGALTPVRPTVGP
jgi:uncharacterized protein